MEREIPERYTRTSFMEMLPDVITDGEMDAMKRHMQSEALGLREHKCAECGRVFICHAEHRYKVAKKGEMVRMYCSYRCYRKYEKQEEEAYRKRVLGTWVEKKPKTPVERARERVRQCEAKLKKAEAEKLKPGWDELTYKQKRYQLRRAAYWQARLVLAETELEEAQKHDD